jgi:hypothetical protein
MVASLVEILIIYSEILSKNLNYNLLLLYLYNLKQFRYLTNINND